MKRAAILLLPFSLLACGSTPRTATNFCRQLEKEVAGIAETPATPNAIDDMVGRYERLLEVAPLAVESDWKALTELLRAAADMDASDTEVVQDVVDQAYSTERAAKDAMQWVMTNCGVDISTGASITPATTTAP